MTSRWFYIVNGTQAGPVNNGELIALASSGRLAPTDLIWRDGLADWQQARQVTGISLFPSSTGSSTSAAISIDVSRSIANRPLARRPNTGLWVAVFSLAASLVVIGGILIAMDPRILRTASQFLAQSLKGSQDPHSEAVVRSEGERNTLHENCRKIKPSMPEDEALSIMGSRYDYEVRIDETTRHLIWDIGGLGIVVGVTESSPEGFWRLERPLVTFISDGDTNFYAGRQTHVPPN